LKIQAEFLTHVPGFLEVLSCLDIYSEHYANVRAPAGLKPRIGLEMHQDANGGLSVYWLPHEDDFEGHSPAIREDQGEVNRIIVLSADDHLAVPASCPDVTKAVYAHELHCTVVQGLRHLVRAGQAVADVELENWVELDRPTGSVGVSSPAFRVNVLAMLARELCIEELEKQQHEMQRLLVVAGFGDLDAYRASQRMSGAAPARANHLIDMARTGVSNSQPDNLELQIQDVMRLQRVVDAFTRTLMAAEAALDE
jgi:hypothetical protein